jgi:hypothetical protein
MMSKWILTAAMAAGLVLAQGPGGKTVEKDVRVIVAGPGGVTEDIHGPELGGAAFTWVNAEMAVEMSSVKGAPFTAEFVSETTQTLADGNRIRNASKSSFARDGEGRTRRESTLSGIGPWADGKAHTTIFINDPVAKVHYVLDPQTKTARKITQVEPAKMAATAGGGMSRGVTVERRGGAGEEVVIERRTAGPGGAVTVERLGGAPAEEVVMERRMGGPNGALVIERQVKGPGGNIVTERRTQGPGGDVVMERRGGGPGGDVVFERQIEGPAGPHGAVFLGREAAGSSSSSAGAAGTQIREMRVIKMDGGDNAKTEPLGKRNIEGVEAEGTRTRLTIPAGQIGNERPLEVVSERWYSNELQTVVLSTRKDPRAGETVYKAQNVRRGEPARQLFEVPSDYKIVEERNVGPIRIMHKIEEKK